MSSLCTKLTSVSSVSINWHTTAVGRRATNPENLLERRISNDSVTEEQKNVDEMESTEAQVRFSVENFFFNRESVLFRRKKCHQKKTSSGNPAKLLLNHEGAPHVVGSVCVLGSRPAKNQSQSVSVIVRTNPFFERNEISLVSITKSYIKIEVLMLLCEGWSVFWNVFVETVPQVTFSWYFYFAGVTMRISHTHPPSVRQYFIIWPNLPNTSFFKYNVWLRIRGRRGQAYVAAVHLDSKLHWPGNDRIRAW